MNRILINIFVVLSLSITLFAQSSVSKRGTTAAQFLNISQGARASGMGSAFVAVADDQSALYWNVAGLARIENGVMVDHTTWIADIGYDFIGVNYNLGGFGAIGLSLINSDIGDMKVTTIDNPDGTGETFSARDVAFSVAWAMNLTDNFSIGFNPKVIYQSIWRMSDIALALDMGILYDTPFKGFTLGMSITNFGPKMQLAGTSTTILYDAEPESSGNNGRIPANLYTEEWDLPLGFKVGVSYKNVFSGMHKILLAVDASHPNDNYESINLGGEYVFNDRFSVRGGYKSLFLDESEETFTLGAGLRQLLVGNVSIRVDYMYGDFGRLKEIQKFSIGVNF
ncbi:MAG: hypothetical protein SCALA702_22150 [Melioribacteraceae bacterium]|nr:MAG: hypothetical protein SCALA702_22150 [Melioribacteraceae bacterium]